MCVCIVLHRAFCNICENYELCLFGLHSSQSMYKYSNQRDFGSPGSSRLMRSSCSVNLRDNCISETHAIIIQHQNRRALSDLLSARASGCTPASIRSNKIGIILRSKPVFSTAARLWRESMGRNAAGRGPLADSILANI
jgi:hypothetical protein